MIRPCDGRRTGPRTTGGRPAGARAPAPASPPRPPRRRRRAAAETAPPPRPLPPPRRPDRGDRARSPPRPDPAAADLFAMPAVAADIRRAFAAADAGRRRRRRRPPRPRPRRPPGDRRPPRRPRRGGDARGRPPRPRSTTSPPPRPPGLPDPAAVAADPVFAPLAADPALGPRLAALAATPPAPPPAPVPAADRRSPAGLVAPVAAANTAWNPAAERLEAFFAPPQGKPGPGSGPVLPARPKTGALDILREHWKRGRAAGNAGDLYDNRDRGHSALKPEAFPQLAHVAYSPEARAAELDYGLQDKLLFDRPTFGNSSTAVTGGVLWRSLPRLAMTASRRHRPPPPLAERRSERPLRLPRPQGLDARAAATSSRRTPPTSSSATAPRARTSPSSRRWRSPTPPSAPTPRRGSSQEHLLVPTVQMIFRRSLQHVTSRESYLSGDAHPAAFEGYSINPARMVSLAQSIEPDAIPPEVRIAVTAEDLGTEGVDYFGAGLSEQLFDTPGAIARIWRSKAATRTMTVSAAETRDPNGRRSTSTGACSRATRRRSRSPPPRTAPARRSPSTGTTPSPSPRTTRSTTSRVDIGVFASNGVHDSRPGDRQLVLPPEREAPHRDRPRRRPAHRRDRPRATPTAPTPTRSSSPAPTGATTSPTPPTARLARLDAGARRPAAPKPSTPPAGACPTRRTPPPRSRSPIRCRGPRTAGSWSRRSTPPPSEAALLRRSMWPSPRPRLIEGRPTEEPA